MIRPSAHLPNTQAHSNIPPSIQRTANERRLKSCRDLHFTVGDACAQIRKSFATIVQQKRRIGESVQLYFAQQETFTQDSGSFEKGGSESSEDNTLMLSKFFALGDFFSQCEATIVERDPILMQLEALSKSLTSELQDALYTLDQRDKSRSTKEHYEIKVRNLRQQFGGGASDMQTLNQNPKITRNEGKLAMSRKDCAELQDRSRVETERALSMSKEGISNTEKLITEGLLGISKSWGLIAAKCYMEQNLQGTVEGIQTKKAVYSTHTSAAAKNIAKAQGVVYGQQPPVSPSSDTSTSRTTSSVSPQKKPQQVTRAGAKEERNLLGEKCTTVEAGVYPNNLPKHCHKENVFSPSMREKGSSSNDITEVQEPKQDPEAPAVVQAPVTVATIANNTFSFHPSLLKDDDQFPQTLTLRLEKPLANKIQRVEIGGKEMKIVNQISDGKASATTVESEEPELDDRGEIIPSPTTTEVTIKDVFPMFKDDVIGDSRDLEQGLKQLKVRVEAKGIDAQQVTIGVEAGGIDAYAFHSPLQFSVYTPVLWCGTNTGSQLKLSEDLLTATRKEGSTVDGVCWCENRVDYYEVEILELVTKGKTRTGAFGFLLHPPPYLPKAKIESGWELKNSIVFGGELPQTYVNRNCVKRNLEWRPRKMLKEGDRVGVAWRPYGPSKKRKFSSNQQQSFPKVQVFHNGVMVCERILTEEDISSLNESMEQAQKQKQIDSTNSNTVAPTVNTGGTIQTFTTANLPDKLYPIVDVQGHLKSIRAVPAARRPKIPIEDDEENENIEVDENGNEIDHVGADAELDSKTSSDGEALNFNQQNLNLGGVTSPSFPIENPLNSYYGSSSVQKPTVAPGTSSPVSPNYFGTGPYSNNNNSELSTSNSPLKAPSTTSTNTMPLNLNPNYNTGPSTTSLTTSATGTGISTTMHSGGSNIGNNYFGTVPSYTAAGVKSPAADSNTDSNSAKKEPGPTTTSGSSGTGGGGVYF